MGWFGNKKKTEEKNMQRQWEYDVKRRDYDIAMRDEKFDFAMDQFVVKKWNENASRDYKNETAKNDWIYREQMREFDYNNQVEAYNASVENYEKQMEFNTLASKITSNDNTRKYNEQLIGIGFQKEELMNKFGWETQQMTSAKERGLAEKAFKGEDMKIAALQKAGQVRAGGGAGRSAAKMMQSVMADFGRNQQRLSDMIKRDDADYEFGMTKASTQFNLGKRQLRQSMMSAKAQYESDQQHNTLQKYKADMAAENNIAAQPVLPPMMPEPLALPETKFAAPKPPSMDPPMPVKGAVASSGFLGGIIGDIFSDDRVKYNITRVGTSPSGIPEYTFKYRFDGEHGPTYKGTSAQDLLAMGRGDAVSQTEKDGFYRVDYSKLDVKMEKIQTV
tara:strand:- start:1726 stop:2895 length:1170 start_codon:yes stop_codon:yes gene_type:complete